MDLDLEILRFVLLKNIWIIFNEHHHCVLSELLMLVYNCYILKK